MLFIFSARIQLCKQFHGLLIKLEMLYPGLTQRLSDLQALLLFWLEILLFHWIELGTLCFLGLML
uniref:Uncharacterized protein n=1 Tax=Arundo donax TaxID=35708 RepID=A0A0A9CPV4_ARUDO